MGSDERAAGEMMTGTRHRLDRQVGFLLIALLIIWGHATSVDASAPRSDCDPATTISTCLTVEDGSIEVGLGESRARRESSTEVTASGVDPGAVGRAQALSAFCADARRNATAGGTALPPEVAALCAPAPAPQAPPITSGMVLRAFRELPLYRGAIRTDPDGWTLVNLETYFWCADGAGESCAVLGEPERVVTLLGRQVRIRPHVTGYTWRFGDGTAQTVGAGRVVHVYSSGLTAVVTVTLTWSADYAVGGGTFQPIGGSTTTTSAPLVLPVREARPVLVGGDGGQVSLAGSKTPR